MGAILDWDHINTAMEYSIIIIIPKVLVLESILINL